MANEIANELSDNGYVVKSIDNARDGFSAADSLDAAVVIVGGMRQGTDNIKIVEKLRNGGLLLPVLFLSNLSIAEERIRGLRASGDDYIAKPFLMTELVERLEVLLRRPSSARKDIELTVGPLRLDLLDRKARRGDREIDLLPMEFQLLEYMMRHRGKIVTRAMLLEDIWNYRFLQTNLADVHLGKVRWKVDGPGEAKLFRSVRTVGYILDAAE